jgi:hypothetical protein
MVNAFKSGNDLPRSRAYATNFLSKEKEESTASAEIKNKDYY